MEGPRQDRVEVLKDAKSNRWSWRFVRGNGVPLANGEQAYVRRAAALSAAAHVLGGTLDLAYGAEGRVHGWIRRPALVAGLPEPSLLEVVQR